MQLGSEFVILSGDRSSETHSHKQPSCQNSLTASVLHSDTLHVQSRESGDQDGAREAGGTQQRQKDTITDNVRAFYTSDTFRSKYLVPAEVGFNEHRQKGSF